MYSSRGKGKGKGADRANMTKKRRHHPGTKSRATETAPHILAALEAQRARALPVLPQQTTPPSTAAMMQESPPPPPPPLPGYVFDPARNRYFRMVKDSLGTPDNISDNRAGRIDGNSYCGRSNMRRKLKITVGAGRQASSGPPPPPLPPPPLPPPSPQTEGSRTGRGSDAPRGRHEIVDGGNMGSSGFSSTAAAATADTVAPARSLSANTGVRGLHWYAMNSRRGFLDSGGRMLGPRRGDGSVGAATTMTAVPAGPARRRRAGVEAAASSSRFRLTSVLLLSTPQAAAAREWRRSNGYSAVDWDAKRGVIAFGDAAGGLGLAAVTSAARAEEETRVLWPNRPHHSNGKVSDINFRRTNGGESACASATLGGAGNPGGVTVRLWRESRRDGMKGLMDSVSCERVSERKLRHGSAWCVEWDPLTSARLAVGPSSCSPVAIFDVERQTLIPVVKLSSDVFSMSFLPAAAPSGGGGRALVCGTRDGSVVLVDCRQPPRQSGMTILVAGGAAADPRRLFGATSVDHTYVLSDGTRCLVKDRSGGLQAVDLRLFSARQQPGHHWSGAGRGRGQGRARPLKVLVPPRGPENRATPGPSRFSVDPSETIVVTPVPACTTAAAATTAATGGNGLGVGGAWESFSLSCPTRHRGTGGTADDGSSAAFGINGGDGCYAHPAFAEGDKLRILNVSSGEVLNDIPTQWAGMSLARGATATSDSPGLRFWGTALEHERGATIFEAALQPEPGSGYGRLR